MTINLHHQCRAQKGASLNARVVVALCILENRVNFVSRYLILQCVDNTILALLDTEYITSELKLKNENLGPGQLRQILFIMAVKAVRFTGPLLLP